MKISTKVKRNNWLSSSNRNNLAIYLSSCVWSTRRLFFYESASIHLAMNKKKSLNSIDCKMLIMCHICGHIKRELFTRLSRNLVAAWKWLLTRTRVRCGESFMMIISNTFQIVKLLFFRLSCLRILSFFFLLWHARGAVEFFLMNSIKVFDLRQCLILVSPRSSCKSIPVNPFISLALCIATIVSFLWWCHASNGLLPLCQPIIIKSLMKCVKLILWLFLTAAGGWQKSNAFVIRTF